MPHDDGCSWLMRLGYAVLTFNSIITIYSSDGNTLQTTLLLTANFFLLILFRWIGSFGQAAPISASVKTVVWLLNTFLAVVFSWKVATTLPLFGTIIVWVIACATSLGGFYAFFIRHRSGNGGGCRCYFCFCFTFLTLISLMTIFGATPETDLTAETDSVVFNVISYLDLIALFLSLCVLEVTPLISSHRERIKFAVWVLLTLLIFMVCSKLAEVFLGPAAVIAFAMAAASSFKVFYAFFLQYEPVLPI